MPQAFRSNFRHSWTASARWLCAACNENGRCCKSAPEVWRLWCYLTKRYAVWGFHNWRLRQFALHHDIFNNEFHCMLVTFIYHLSKEYMGVKWQWLILLIHEAISPRPLCHCSTCRPYGHQPTLVKWCEGSIWWRHQMKTSKLRVIGPFCGEFLGHRWIPLTKASDALLGCLLWSASEQRFE